MSRVYSTQFLSVGASTEASSYEVPAGYVAILRDLQAVGPSTPGGVFIESGTIGLIIIASWASADAFGVGQASWSGRTVINAGDELTIIGASGSEYGVLSGYLLTV